jgi:hypothetical protein
MRTILSMLYPLILGLYSSDRDELCQTKQVAIGYSKPIALKLA